MGMEVERRVHGLTVDAVRVLVEQGTIISKDGEIVSVADADTSELVVWNIVAQRLRTIAREVEIMTNAELGVRIRENAGALKVDGVGEAFESISRGSVSGISAKQIRETLEGFAEDGVIPWDAVENLAPMIPHVTPAHIAQYTEDAPDKVRDRLLPLLPTKRRTIKVTETPA